MCFRIFSEKIKYPSYAYFSFATVPVPNITCLDQDEQHSDLSVLCDLNIYSVKVLQIFFFIVAE